MGDPGQGARDLCSVGVGGRRRQSGATLIELLGALAVACVALLVSLLLSNDWILREAARSAVYEVQSHLQLARAHAITRSHKTRFVIDQATRRIEIFDLNDPGDPNDDLLLSAMTLSRTIEFDRPDAGAPITLHSWGGSRYDATFLPEGSVHDGVGEIVIEAGGAYHKVSLYAAGGVGVQRWNGAAWQKGA